MGRISQSIPNLFNGVSQQSPTLRMRSQGESQLNLYSTIAAGLSKRPPTKHLAKLRSGTVTDAKIHMINRDDTEQYIVVMMDGDLEVYDLDGVEQTVNFPRGVDYLDVTTPRTDFELMTVADYTFILNKGKTPAMLNKGNDYVINGTFAVDQYWTKGTGWTIGSGVASCDGSQSAWTYLQQDISDLCIKDRTYEISYDLTVSAGNFKITLGNTNGTTRTSSGSYTDTIVFDAALDNLYLAGDSNFTGTIDNVTLKEVSDSSWTPCAIIWVKNGVADTDYRITVDGTTIAYTTGSTSNPNTYKTHEIAYQLYTTFNASGPSGFTASQLIGDQKSSIVKIVKDNSGEFTFSCTDTWGEQALEGFYKEVHDYGDLPPKCFDEIRAHIKGSSMTKGDDYYAEFNEETSLWEETIGWDQDNYIDWDTMPWTLINNGSSFDFVPIDWERRLVGDENSAPAPSFIGEPIKDISFYRNRLGVIAGEAVVLSCTGDFFNFWRDTVTQVLDTDPIDSMVSHNKVSVLQFAIPYNEDLLLFSNQTQFCLTSENYLTPTSVTIDQTTEFENSLLCRPIGAGSYLYFCLERGDYTGVKEYFIDSEKNNRDAADITAHVPRYIPKNVFRLEASSNEDVLLCLTLDERNATYVYKYYWSGDEKLQSAWSKWTFGSADVILDVAMIETSVYFVVQRTDGVFLERMDLQSNLEDGNLGFAVNLDRRVEVTGVYSSGDDWTTWTIPYEISTDDEVVVVRNDQFEDEEGNVISGCTRPSTTTVRVTGDYSDDDCYLGLDYEARYRLSRQYVRSGDSHEESITEGNLILQFLTVVFHDSGSFHVEIDPQNGSEDTYDYVHTVVLGSQQATIGEAFISTGTLKVPVLADSEKVIIDLVNANYLPSSWQAIEWEGIHVMFTSRN